MFTEEYSFITSLPTFFSPSTRDAPVFMNISRALILKRLFLNQHREQLFPWVVGLPVHSMQH